MKLATSAVETREYCTGCGSWSLFMYVRGCTVRFTRVRVTNRTNIQPTRGSRTPPTARQGLGIALQSSSSPSPFFSILYIRVLFRGNCCHPYMRWPWSESFPSVIDSSWSYPMLTLRWKTIPPSLPFHSIPQSFSQL
jgi:hypothetical protein